MKVLRFIKNNILFVFTLILLALIPLYPKLPLVDIPHTWVYIRVEDFAVAFVVLVWTILLLAKKVTLYTPLTLPIMVFWIIGAVATIHGVLIIFPTLSDVFYNVAFLSFLRRIEYMFLFFIAYASIKDKKFINYIIAVLAVVLILIVGYGFGQKFLGFPAFLTMNEEFAKGIPIQLSELSRVPSTFAGHYDLAAYLVLIIPLLTSLAFACKNWFARASLLISSALGFILLFMTVSRVSFFVLLLSLIILLLLQKKKWIIVSLFAITIILLIFSPSLMQRFGSTFSEVDVLVNAKTGEAIGHTREVPAKYFENKVVVKEFTSEKEMQKASSSAIVLFSMIPQEATLLTQTNSSTGENLPQGTGYVNLPLSPITKKISQYFYEKPQKEGKANAEDARVVYGEFLIKKAVAYDLSFTTRVQGEWPRTIGAFKRNIFLGSGYGSVSLAVDNDYLRVLGESGLLGFIAFLSIFLIAGIYIKKTLPLVESPLVRGFVFGFVAGTFGLLLNAVLIDVFEASKIAFTYWLLMGITLGMLSLYRKEKIDLYKEFTKLIFSTQAVIIYLFAVAIAFFSSFYNYYFVGDDFTWLRGISDINYFTQASKLIYEPGTKLYFLFMYSAFWLNQTMYHVVSIFLHFAVAVTLFFLTRQILKDHFLAAMSASLFIILSGHSEAIFWISSTDLLFNALFTLLSLLFFIYWKEKKSIVYFVGSVLFIIVSLLFHELGVMIPLIIIIYDIVFGEKSFTNISKKWYYFVILFPLLPYFALRLLVNNYWLSDFNLIKIPFNFLGYIGLTFFGPMWMSLYEKVFFSLKEQILIILPTSFILVFIILLGYKIIRKKFTKEEEKIAVFGFLFFVIALFPFLGLGDIAFRYSYLSSAAFVIVLALFFKKIYQYLRNINGQYNTLFGAIIIIIFFCMIHLFQLQKTQIDWKVAGEKSKQFLISLNQMYTQYWTKESMIFYFVDTPVKKGDAWLFANGLSDAVWFAFRNNNIKVYQASSLEEAFAVAKDLPSEKVFVFDNEGRVSERKKPRATFIPVR